MEHITTIFVALIGGGLVGLVQFLIQRKDSKDDKFGEVMHAIDGLREKIELVDKKGDERAAISARVRILRFMDEMNEGRRHSKDSFDQALSDIDYYEKYCDKNKDFKNNQTAATVEHIKRVYAERLEKRDFL